MHTSSGATGLSAGKRRRAARLKVGMRVRGRVVGFDEHGSARIAIGRKRSAYMAAHEYSWIDPLVDLRRVLKVGQWIDVVVKKVQFRPGGTLHVAVSYRRTQPNPWEQIDRELQVGSRTWGRVRKLGVLGAYIVLDTGYLALVPHRELSWEQHPVRAEELFSEGQWIEVVIRAIHPANRKIVASYRQTLEHPLAAMSRQFPPGSVVDGVVERLAEFGAIIRLENGCKGLLPCELMQPADGALQQGQAVRVRIESYDLERRRVRFSSAADVAGGADTPKLAA